MLRLKAVEMCVSRNFIMMLQCVVVFVTRLSLVTELQSVLVAAEI